MLSRNVESNSLIMLHLIQWATSRDKQKVKGLYRT